MKCFVKKVNRSKLREALDDTTRKLARTIKSNLGFSKVVYLSHPYGGAEMNAQVLKNCQRMLSKIHPDWLVIDPVAAFGNLYNFVGYKEGLNMTLFLLSMLADEMIVCTDDYHKSKGCVAEIEFCKRYNIPITYTTEDAIVECYCYN